MQTKEILETIKMIDEECLDIRTITMGISLMDCMDPDIHKSCEKIEKKTNEITRLLNNKAANFTDQVKKEIEGKINILNDGLQNKQESIQKYNEFLQYINNAKDELSGFSFD